MTSLFGYGIFIRNLWLAFFVKYMLLPSGEMSLHYLLCLSTCYVLAAAIWPQPAHYTHSNDVVWLDRKVDFSFHDEFFIAVRQALLIKTSCDIETSPPSLVKKTYNVASARNPPH